MLRDFFATCLTDATTAIHIAGDGGRQLRDLSCRTASGTCGMIFCQHVY